MSMFEVDERYQNAGENRRHALRPERSAAPCTPWVKQPGHGTYANDPPPIIHSISRAAGEERCPLVGQSDTATCHGILAEAGSMDGTIVYSDAYQSYHGIEPQHATVSL